MAQLASWPMPREAEAREWWADVYEVRERIERRRARESAPARSTATRPGSSARRRGVREIRTSPPLALAAQRPKDGRDLRRRRPAPRPVERIGHRPDRIAAWAVAMGVLLLVLAILSSH